MHHGRHRKTQAGEHGSASAGDAARLCRQERSCAVRAEIQKNGYKCELEIDGGAKLNNTADIVAAGADVIVAGSAVFGGDIAANVKGFHEVFKEGAAKAAWSK